MQVSKSCPPAIHNIVRNLEAQGFELQMYHDPELPRRIEDGPVGRGSTYIQARKDGTFVAYGIAVCSQKDHFCKATGTKVAIDRLIHALKEKYGRSKIKEWLEK